MHLHPITLSIGNILNLEKYFKIKCCILLTRKEYPALQQTTERTYEQKLLKC